MCLKLPYKCYAWDEQDRRLVRSYLSDYIPKEILSISNRRGRQSGDSVLRYNSFGLPDGRKPIEALNSRVERYFDLEKVREGLEDDTDLINISWKEKVLSCSFFLEKLKDNQL